MPGWVKTLLDEWIQSANLTAGKLFRRVNKNGKAWGDGLTEKAIWHVVSGSTPTKQGSSDLRRTIFAAMPLCRRRTGADTVPSRARLHPNHGAFSGL